MDVGRYVWEVVERIAHREKGDCSCLAVKLSTTLCSASLASSSSGRLLRHISVHQHKKARCPAMAGQIVHVLGGGALGCLWAARLRTKGVEAVLLLRPGSSAWHTTQIGAKGNDERYVHVSVDARWPGCSDADHISTSLPVQLADASMNDQISTLVITTKVHAAQAALRQLGPRLTSNTAALILCNGALALCDEMSASSEPLPMQMVLATTTHGSWVKSPFNVVHAGFGSTWFGLPASSRHSAGSNDAMARVGEVLLASGLGGQAEDNIEERLWKKLAANVVLNPLTALWRCINGEVLEREEGRAIAQELCAEMAAVLVAMRGPVALNEEDLHDFVVRCAADNAKNRSSMYQDVEAGRKTEIEYLTGWIAHCGEMLGVPTPRSEDLAQKIRALHPPEISD